MLPSYKPIAFVGVKDAEAARAFYGGTLGLRLRKDELPFALVYDAGGFMLRVTPAGELRPVKFTVLGWEVPDLEAGVRELQGRGVVFERFGGGMQQDELGIWTAPGGGARVAWFKDPDGNTLSLSQHSD
jgi:catechol 2,3-dioxygenase-like lactoylglutathione lyase family enzyme